MCTVAVIRSILLIRAGLADEDHEEFGYDSFVAKTLDALGEDWNNTEDETEREKLHKRAELLRGLARIYISRGNTNQVMLMKGYNTIIKYENRINSVASTLGINPHLIATVLFREITMSGWDDLYVVETGAATIGVDTSIGIGQVKVSTATEAYDRWMYHLLGDAYNGHNLSVTQFVKMLNDPKENIRFVGIVIWNIIHTYGAWDEIAIYSKYNAGGNSGNTSYGTVSMQYTPYVWEYFN